MKVFIYIDRSNTVKCLASDECNLWKRDEWGEVRMFYVDPEGTIGDQYDPRTNEWTIRQYYYLKDGVWVFDAALWIAEMVRPGRNRRLSEADFVMLQDVSVKLTREQLKKWTDYRQELRDLPQSLENITEPVEIRWPVTPEYPGPDTDDTTIEP